MKLSDEINSIARSGDFNRYDLLDFARKAEKLERIQEASNAFWGLLSRMNFDEIDLCNPEHFRIVDEFNEALKDGLE